MHKEKHFFNAAMEAGVQGYLLKDNAIQDLIQCIEAVLKGKRAYVSPAIEHSARTQRTTPAFLYRGS